MSDRYKIMIRSGNWKSFFYMTAREDIMRRDIIRKMGAASDGGRIMDIWDPANPRGDIMPNMQFEFLEDGILVEYFGGDDGRNMERLKELIMTWQDRYRSYDLCMNELQ